MPTVDYQVSASDNDGLAYSYLSQIIKNGNIAWGKDSNGYSYGLWLLFTGVTIPAGATITASYITFNHNSIAGSPAGKLYFEKAANPSIPSSYADFGAKPRTTNYINVTSGTGEWNTDSINAILQELVDAYDYSSGSNMQVLVVQNVASKNNYYLPKSWDNDNSLAPELHIEYTEGNSIVPVLIGQRFRRIT